jgi:dihydroneopterin aldolase
MSLYTVELKNIKMTANHGYYERENLTGNNFLVNVTVSFHKIFGKNVELKETVDYEKLYHLVELEMIQRRDLLEEVAGSMLKNILKMFPDVIEVKISLEKLAPPIQGFKGESVKVSLSHKE